MRRSTLRVEEFGPISKAEIEIRPLTVFVGPSNTGKSYLAILMYAMHRFFSGATFEFFRNGLFSSPRLISSNFDQQHHSVYREVAKWLIRRARAEQSRADQSQPLHAIPETISTHLRPLLKTITELSSELEDEICRCFGVDNLTDLIRHGSNQHSQVVCETVPHRDSLSCDPIRYQFRFGNDGSEFTSSIPSTVELKTTLKMKDMRWSIPWPTRGGTSDHDWEYIDEVLEFLVIPELLENIFAQTFQDFCKTSYYLPADRAGMMHAHKIFIKSLIGRSFRLRKGPELSVPGLSGVLTDFLEQLIDLADHSKARKPTIQSDIASELEKNMLHGTVTINDSIVRYPSFQFTPNGWNKERSLPLLNASSMVSEIAPVVLYLQSIVGRDEMLIIEEPESHLHPEMQVKFFRYLVHAVRAGTRIVVITHSDWIMEELANVIRSSSLEGNKRSGIEGAAAVLDPDQVGIWYFLSKHGNHGSVVQELTLDVESGMIPAGFEDVSESLYNRWAEVVNRIEESN